jgi:cytoplasmic tRNA 2-thiolation protein 2
MFELHVLWVDDSLQAAESDENQKLLNKFKEVQKQFPGHQYSTVPISKVYEMGVAHDIPGHPQETDSNSHSEMIDESQPPKDSASRLIELLSSLPSATSRSDVLNTLRTRLIMEFAKASDCDMVVWGSSTTRLAEQTLAETAKGRGFSLVWQTADGPSPYGVELLFPLRDLLKKELGAYAEVTEPQVSTLVLPDEHKQGPSINPQSTSIDLLMKQYFESVEDNYPSIVTNVVKTSGKLEALQVDETAPKCVLCSMPVVDGAFGLHGWGGMEESTSGPENRNTDGSSQLCYGCARSVPEPTELLPRTMP